MIVKTGSTKARFSRRAFLRQVGVSAAMVPLLHAEHALAATPSGFPKRIVTIAWPNGVCQSLFYPSDDNPVSNKALTPLAPYQSKVIMVAGTDFQVMLDGNHDYDGHYTYPVIFTGAYKNTGGQTSTSGGPSIDQVISDSIAKQVNLPVPLLSTVIDGSSTSFRAAGQKNTGENSPSRLFSKLFSTSTMPDAQVTALRNRRKSVLDFVGQELSGFETRMGTDDRAKIDAHLQSVRQLETQLTAAGVSCTPPTTNTTSKNYQDQVKAFADITAMALRCDMTRVATLTWGDNAGSFPQSFPFLGLNGDCHALAHQGPSGYPQKVLADQWHYSQVAGLVKQLNDTPEGAGTALDNTVVVVASDMGEGGTHQVGGVPFVLIGGCGGYFKTGQVVRLGKWASKSGQYWVGANQGGGEPHNKLLATLCNAMGVSVAGFGDSRYPGTLDQLKA